MPDIALKVISITPMESSNQAVIMDDIEQGSITISEGIETSDGMDPPQPKSNLAFTFDPKDSSAFSHDSAVTNEKIAELFIASSERPPSGNGEQSQRSSSRAQSRSRSELLKRNNSAMSSVTQVSSNCDICRICHCEEDDNSPLITPCLCMGSLEYVHQACIQQWIKSSNTKSCELCRFNFVMQTKLKPFGKWEQLEMTPCERRRIICSVSFHIITIACVVWALYVLIERTSADLLVNNGSPPWPFWTKLVVVAIGFTGGLVFMYVQCKVYLQLWLRLKAYNRVIYVQNCPPEERLKAKRPKTIPELPPQPRIEIIN